MLYRFLRFVAAIAVRWYYRRIEVEGLDRIPSSGPAILAANHWNALVDALLIGTAISRPVRLTAKATLLDNPLTRVIVHAVGVIPLRRASDERQRAAPLPESRNAESFAAILDALADNQLVLIFPEGKSHNEPALAPLKTGCARLALAARSERGLKDISIIPVGLTFESKGKPRSRVAIVVGEPVTLSGMHDASPNDVKLLTARLDDALRRVTLNFPDHDSANQVLEATTLLNQLLDRVRPLHAPDAPLLDALRIAHRLESARQLLPGAPPDVAAEADDFLARLRAFRTRARDAKVPINDLWMPLSAALGVFFVVREVAVHLLVLPVAAWGRINHWLPISIARWLGRATSRNQDEPAMHTLVAGLALVAVFYTLAALLLGYRYGAVWALLYLASLPPSASIDFWLSDRMRRATRRARGYLTLRGNPSLRESLLAAAAELRADARRLDARFP